MFFSAEEAFQLRGVREPTESDGTSILCQKLIHCWRVNLKKKIRQLPKDIQEGYL